MNLRYWRILSVCLCLIGWGLAAVVGVTQPVSIALPKAESSPKAQASEQAMNAKLIAANTRLSFKLFSAILQQQPDQNIFISPASVAIALSMTYNGAKGETQEAIAQTLELQGMSLEDINQGNAILRATFTHLDPKVQLSLANSLWARKGEPFVPEFLQKNQDFYGAKITDLDFSDPSTPSIINTWVKQSTNGKIDTIIDGKEIEPDTILFLINAIYFKGLWTKPFDKTKTQELPFTLLNGTQKAHPIMFQQAQYGYYANHLFQAVTLPYGQERLSLYIFLPQENVSLQTFYKNLNAENWEQWMNQFEAKQVLVGLPRFRLDYGLELNDILKSLGMAIAFDQNRADFTGMTPRSAYISRVKHNTFFEVNEEGSEAAGATLVEMGTRSAPPQLIADRPFFCVIRDNQTKTILFMGSIVKPQ